jgi:GTPase SAR1 family protein
VRAQSESDAVIALVGNQKDRDGDREVSYEQGLRFAKENNINFFMEVSAKTNENVE